MKKLMLIWLGLIISSSVLAAGDDAGNGMNDEKICGLRGNSLSEAVKNCKRGDIIPLMNRKLILGIKICDFTKAIVTDKDQIVACVYTGKIRDGDAGE